MADQSVPLATIAQFLDLTERRVNQLVKEGVLPRADRGKYPFLGCVKGYIKYLRAMANDGSLSLTDERTRLTRAQAEGEEMKVKALKGDLIHRDTAERVWEDVIVACRSRLLSMPSKVAPIVVHCKTIPEIRDKIESLVHEALNELSRIDPTDYANHPEGVEAMDPAPEVGRKRVGRPKKNVEPGGLGGAGSVADLQG